MVSENGPQPKRSQGLDEARFRRVPRASKPTSITFPTDLERDASGLPPTPPSIQLWRSVRAGGETKTKRSRRTLELPALCVDALREHRQRQVAQRIRMGQQWVDNDLVFATRYGTELDAASVRRAFRTVAAAALLEASEWTPRELRHNFVSLLSSSGVPIEDIAQRSIAKSFGRC
jgi:integrase